MAPEHRAKVIASLETLKSRDGILLPAAGGGRIDINDWRTREWTPALKAAGVEHRRIDDGHTFATWSLAAGMSIFTLARPDGTSVPWTPTTKLVWHVAGAYPDETRNRTSPGTTKRAPERGF